MISTELTLGGDDSFRIDALRQWLMTRLLSARRCLLNYLTVGLSLDNSHGLGKMVMTVAKSEEIEDAVTSF